MCLITKYMNHKTYTTIGKINKSILMIGYLNISHTVVDRISR
jgi:hypothetical protein